MQRPTPVILAAVTLLAPAAHAQTVIDFEDLLAASQEGDYDLSNPTYGDFYADQGMTMSATESVWFGEGVSQGDPFQFDIEGTNGPSFIALFNPDPAGTIVFAFDETINLSIDLITTALIPGDVPVNILGIRDGKIVFNTNASVPGAAGGDPDGRATNYTFEQIDQIHFTTPDDHFHVLAFDNLVFDAAACSPADLNADGVLDFFDVSAFLSAFTAGCP